MALTRLNASGATSTKNRTDSICLFSGMCTTCVDGCLGTCEIGRSAIRGAEVIYPQPFGSVTAASEKDYPIDLSHFNIMGTAVGAYGVEPSSDAAIFPAVNLETAVGRDGSLKCKLPFIIPGLGSTDVAKNNWEGLAIGAALSGVPLTIGENVCGMDDSAVIENGRVVSSPDLERRVKLYKEWQLDGYGEIIVQSNVEDTNLGVLEYAIEKLGVKAVELKWGQGAKDIGGEVKISSLEKAQRLYDRGYIVLPNPRDPAVIEAFNAGVFREFERHSRLGMVSEDAFASRVQELRDMGAKYVFLKTGAYRPADLARAVKWSSKYQIDLLTIDGAGGGTGMSPWRMMNEWGIPTVEIWSLAYNYLDTLAMRGEYVPPTAFAGGITMEDQIFKVLALGAPYVKLVGMARGPLAAAMVGKNVGSLIAAGNIPGIYKRYGSTIEEVFVGTIELRRLLDGKYKDVPPGAIGLFTYYQRLAQGLRQLMAGARKFALQYISRDDIAAITREAAEVSGIAYITELDADEVESILNS
ncbi:MAG: FMN-binding glutamate synthase family protein [Armatimonadota bacterium]